MQTRQLSTVCIYLYSTNSASLCLFLPATSASLRQSMILKICPWLSVFRSQSLFIFVSHCPSNSSHLCNSLPGRLCPTASICRPSTPPVCVCLFSANSVSIFSQSTLPVCVYLSPVISAHFHQTLIRQLCLFASISTPSDITVCAYY